MTDLRIISNLPPAPVSEVISMLEAVLAEAKAGRLTYAVVVHDEVSKDDVCMKWQGLSSISAVRGAVTGMETAKLAILQKFVKAT
jgi:calcineurin-like phosphoesterase